jgi:hypothetical protein
MLRPVGGLMALLALFASQGCAGSGAGKCNYTKSTSDGYEYACLNVSSEDECTKEHPSSGDYTAGECCDEKSTKVDNPEDCKS